MADRWTDSETFDLGFMLGMGMTAVDAADVMGRSLGAVQMRMLRLRKKMPNRRDGSAVVPITVYPQAKRVIDEAAAFRGQRREHVIERLCQIVGEEGALFLENLLDDQM